MVLKTDANKKNIDYWDKLRKRIQYAVEQGSKEDVSKFADDLALDIHLSSPRLEAQYFKQYKKNFIEIINIIRKICYCNGGKIPDDIIYNDSFKKLVGIPFFVQSAGRVSGSFILDLYADCLSEKNGTDNIYFCSRDVYEFHHTPEELLNKKSPEYWHTVDIPQAKKGEKAYNTIVPKEYKEYLKLKTQIRDRRDQDSPVAKLFQQLELPYVSTDKAEKLYDLIEYILYENPLGEIQGNKTTKDLKLWKILDKPPASLFSDLVAHENDLGDEVLITDEKALNHNKIILFLLTELVHHNLEYATEIYRVSEAIIAICEEGRDALGDLINIVETTGEKTYHLSQDKKVSEFYEIMKRCLDKQIKCYKWQTKANEKENVWELALFGLLKKELILKLNNQRNCDNNSHYVRNEQICNLKARELFYELYDFNKPIKKIDEIEQLLSQNKSQLKLLFSNKWQSLFSKAKQLWEMHLYRLNIHKALDKNNLDVGYFIAIMQIIDAAHNSEVSIDNTSGTKEKYYKKARTEFKPLTTILRRCDVMSYNDLMFLSHAIRDQYLLDVGWDKTIDSYMEVRKVLDDAYIEMVKKADSVDELFQLLDVTQKVISNSYNETMDYFE